MAKSTRKKSKPFYPKVMKTTAEHESALARIEELFNAKPGTVEGDELELLALPVETYGEQGFPPWYCCSSAMPGSRLQPSHDISTYA